MIPTKERYDNWIPYIKAIDIGDGIKYRLHKHWGMNIWAGEGQFIHNGDRSGCLIDFDILGNFVNKSQPASYVSCCSKPIVVLQRIYYKDKKQISAILSYPNGLSLIDDYFWEIYPTKDGDIERFSDEEKMEEYIKELFKEAK